MLQHFRSCEELNYKLDIYSLADIFSDNGIVDHMANICNSVTENCKITKLPGLRLMLV